MSEDRLPESLRPLERRGEVNLWNAVAGVGMFAALAVMTMIANPPKERTKHNQNFEEKMKDFMEVRDSVEVVAFGASHVENAVDPSAIESFEVFNFGLPGVRGFQMESTIRSVLDKNPSNMKIALIGISRWPGGVMTWEQHYSPSWHDPEHFPEALAWSFRHAPTMKERTSTITSFLRRYIPAGDSHRGWGYHPSDQYIPARSDGFRDPSNNFEGASKARNAMLDMPSPRVPVDVETDTRVSIEGLRRIANLCESHGVRPVFIRPPNAKRYGDESREDYSGLEVLWFDDTSKYPDLFLKNNRWDSIHLNPDGAKIFSAMVEAELSKGQRAIASSATSYPEYGGEVACGGNIYTGHA